jgi:hypothetical protein
LIFSGCPNQEIGEPFIFKGLKEQEHLPILVWIPPLNKMLTTEGVHA